MIIDALRLDFVQKMNFTNDFITEGKACVFPITVHPPTVTMPRIKAITSGTIPSFIDVVLNLGSAEMKADSFIYQLFEKGKKIVFYGANTWTTMFPNYFFRHQENEESLFVTDFHDGDKNITDNVITELNNKDWNFMILHYLGLDNIGHIEGPFSSKMPAKLEEMDKVILKIDREMRKWNKYRKLPSLFLITGDHGMRDSGGHGGSSFSEVNVPLIIIGSECSEVSKSYPQTDIATTLSVLLGLPIPAESIGSIIPELLINYDEEEQLYLLYYSSKRLFDKMFSLFDESDLLKKESSIQYKEALIAHKMFLESLSESESGEISVFKKSKLLYIASSQEMSDVLASNFVKYDLFSIFVGILISLMVSFFGFN